MENPEPITEPEILERVEELRAENRGLSAEVDGLRRFLSSMLTISGTMDRPRRDDGEILELLENVLDSTLYAIDAEGGSLLVADEDDGDLVFALVRGDPGSAELVGSRIPAGKGIASWVATHRRATIVNNTGDDDRFYREVDSRFAHRTRSVIAAPLLGGGRLLGVIEMVNRQGGKLFTMSNQTVLSLMCRFAGELLFTLVREVDLGATIERTAARRRVTSEGEK